MEFNSDFKGLNME